MDSQLTLERKHFHFTKSKIFLFISVISNVNKLSWMSKPIVAEENSLRSLKLALKLGTRLVHSLVSLQEFCNKEDNLIKDGILTHFLTFSLPMIKMVNFWYDPGEMVMATDWTLALGSPKWTCHQRCSLERGVKLHVSLLESTAKSAL